MALRIPHAAYTDLVTACVRRLPVEACGVISAEGRVVPIRNALLSTDTFAMDPAQQLRAWQQIEESGDAVYAVYHSHPMTDAVPSLPDQQYAQAYPSLHHVILGRASFDDRVLRSWAWSDGELVEEDVVLLVS